MRFDETNRTLDGREVGDILDKISKIAKNTIYNAIYNAKTPGYNGILSDINAAFSSYCQIELDNTDVSATVDMRGNVLLSYTIFVDDELICIQQLSHEARDILREKFWEKEEELEEFGVTKFYQDANDILSDALDNLVNYRDPMGQIINRMCDDFVTYTGNKNSDVWVYGDENGYSYSVEKINYITGEKRVYPLQNFGDEVTAKAIAILN